jgi:hypothetical protein
VHILPTVAITHHGGQSTSQTPEAMFLALHRARRQFYARYYPASWNHAARVLAQAGLIVATMRTFLAYRCGNVSWAECRIRAHRYGRVWRLWRSGM